MVRKIASIFTPQRMYRLVATHIFNNLTSCATLQLLEGSRAQVEVLEFSEAHRRILLEGNHRTD